MERKLVIMKKGLRKIIVTCVVLLIVVVGFYLYLNRASAIQYTEETARTMDIETHYTFSGNLEPGDAELIYATGRGTVKEWYFDEGDQVEEDDAVLLTSGGNRIKSTMSGTISDLYVEEGEDYSMGDALLRVADYSHPVIHIEIDEYDIAAIKKGQQVNIKVQATGEALTGTVKRIAQEATVVNDVAYYAADIEVNSDGSVKMGLTCEITVPRESVYNATTVSMNAIQYDDDGKPYVYMYDRNDKVLEQSVLLGINNGTIVEIKDGVRSGETVLIPPAGMNELMKQMMQTRTRGR